MSSQQQRKMRGPCLQEAGKGRSKMSENIKHGYHLVEGKMGHAMEDYVFAQFKEVDDENELGLFAIFDGHLSQEVPNYLRSHLFENILNEPNFWSEPESAMRRAYRITDSTILEKAAELGRGGSTAVTAILINGQKLVVANVGDSRAVICKNGVAKQLSVDHEPEREKKVIEDRGGFVSNFPVVELQIFGPGASSLFRITGYHLGLLDFLLRKCLLGLPHHDLLQDYPEHQTSCYSKL
nr:probable protein phosphatase 2C 39 [Ipomoea batatas]